MANDMKVELVGLKEFRNALRKLSTDFPKEMRLGFREVAIDVAQRVAAKVPVGETGNAAASVKPRASQLGAGVAAGGAKVPYYGFLDFGGRVGKDRRISRPFIPQGRYLFPTIEEEHDQIIAAAEKVVDDATRRAGF
jgi:hypothetical protein